uniref:Uncharacterized protein n=1 Tax=viral metagenome TaxID=1070528 RepID=A0A6C0KVE2_9ZZZZ
MGAGQSSQKANSTTPQVSANTERVELFSLIFMRLLNNTDILDIKALTKGPGACGDYVILLTGELDKEFSKIKMANPRSGSGIEEFLFQKSKTVTTESPADQAMCRSLAIFYMRALQLVSALTLSIYTPPDLVSRMRNRVLKEALGEQERAKPLDLQEKEKLSVKRQKWFLSFFNESDDTTVTMTGNPAVTYDKLTNMLTLTLDKLIYKVKLVIKDLDSYKISEEATINSDPKGIMDLWYWVELIDPNKGITVHRALLRRSRGMVRDVNSKQIDRNVRDNSLHRGGNAYIFENVAPKDDEDTPNDYTEDWPSKLSTFIRDSGVTATPVPTPRNNNSVMTRRAVRFGPSYGGARKTSKRKMRGGELDTLPPKYKQSYESLVRWSQAFGTWTEAAPASYREVLLYIAPSSPSSPATSYVCIDKWAGKSMRSVPPYAALESLYFNKDDGTPTPENTTKLADLVATFRALYQKNSPPPKLAANTSKLSNTFSDVYLPPVNSSINTLLCTWSTAQGEVMMKPAVAIVFQKARDSIVNLQKAYFENAFGILKRVFTTSTNPSGQTVVNFSDEIEKSGKGARATLEEVISQARGLIAAHYLKIEEIYLAAIAEAAALPQNPTP